MKVTNPGNFLPFYTRTDWQRHRQTGQDVLPFGLIAPNTRLMPFQLYGETGTAGTVTFTLVNAAVEGDTRTISAALLDVDNRTGGGWWVTWKAGENLDVIPPCGFWYVVVGVGSDEYVSEVLQLVPDATTDVVGLTLPSGGCSIDEFISIEVEADDTLADPGGIISETIEFYAESMWNSVGTNAGVIEYADFPPNSIQVRRTVVNSGGTTITAYFTITWDDSDPCATLTLTQQSIQQGGGNTPDRWVLRCQNFTDKNTVLYQTGYEQKYYLRPVHIVPVVDEELEDTVNGFGDFIARYQRAVERTRFEFPDVPDYVLHTFRILRVFDSVFLENVATSAGYELTNVDFSSRRQGPSLNIGVITSDRRIAVNSGCQTNFSLV